MEKRPLSKSKSETAASEKTRNMDLDKTLYKQKADRKSTKELIIKPGDQDVPRNRDRRLELQQSLWKERQDDHNVPKSTSNAGQHSLRPNQGDNGASNLSKRSDVLRSPNQDRLKRGQKKIPLRGGGDQEDSSSQQQVKKKLYNPGPSLLEWSEKQRSEEFALASKMKRLGVIDKEGYNDRIKWSGTAHQAVIDHYANKK